MTIISRVRADDAPLWNALLALLVVASVLFCHGAIQSTRQPLPEAPGTAETAAGDRSSPSSCEADGALAAVQMAERYPTALSLLLLGLILWAPLWKVWLWIRGPGAQPPAEARPLPLLPRTLRGPAAPLLQVFRL